VPFPIPTRPARRSGRQPAFPTPPLPKPPRAPEAVTAGPPRAPEAATKVPPHAFDPFVTIPPAATTIPPVAATSEPAATTIPPVATTIPPVATTIPPSRSIEPITAATFAALRPNQPAATVTGAIGPITAANLEPAPPEGWDGKDRRRWDGIERRKGWVSGQPPVAEPSTNPLPAEPRTVPLRELARAQSSGVDRRRLFGLAVACSAIVASVTSVVTVRFLWPGHPTVSATAPALAQTPSAPAAIDSVPAVVAPPATPVDTPADTRADTPADPPAPTPTPVVTTPPHRPVRVHHTPLPANPVFLDTQPKPSAPTPAVTPAPVPTPVAAAPLAPPPETAEERQIRAEIAARKHRVDSLAQLVDSLRITQHATQPHAPVTPHTP
jgi:hypothetical protein